MMRAVSETLVSLRVVKPEVTTDHHEAIPGERRQNLVEFGPVRGSKGMHEFVLDPAIGHHQLIAVEGFEKLAAGQEDEDGSLTWHRC